jgi:hypothetical protein
VETREVVVKVPGVACEEVETMVVVVKVAGMACRCRI